MISMTKQTVLDLITIQENGVIFLRTTVKAFDDDGSLIGQRFVRQTLTPGSDVSSFPQRVQRLTQIFWTQDVIDAYLAKIAAGPPVIPGTLGGV